MFAHPILCSAEVTPPRYIHIPVPVIKATSLRDLKNRVNIHDVVVRVVSLKKAGGGRFKGLCPFHSEKTPSFNVSGAKGFYRCFGCGVGGDVIHFVMSHEHLSFVEAVERLAAKGGIQLRYEDGPVTGQARPGVGQRQRLVAANAAAAEFYVAQLGSAGARTAREFLAARGFDGRMWPYGNEFDEKKSGSDWREPWKERELPPVTQLEPETASPFGVTGLGCAWE